MRELTRDEAIKKVNETFPKERRSQQAVVDLMTSTSSFKRIVHEIPGGAHLTDEEDEESLKLTVFQWLRRTSEFDRWELSLVGDYTAYEDLKDEKEINTRRTVVVDFNHKPNQPVYWKRTINNARKGLAVLIAKALGEYDNVVSIVVDKEGMSVITDASQKFGPKSEHWNPVLIIQTKIIK